MFNALFGGASATPATVTSLIHNLSADGGDDKARATAALATLLRDDPASRPVAIDAHAIPRLVELAKDDTPQALDALCLLVSGNASAFAAFEAAGADVAVDRLCHGTDTDKTLAMNIFITQDFERDARVVHVLENAGSIPRIIENLASPNANCARAALVLLTYMLEVSGPARNAAVALNALDPLAALVRTAPDESKHIALLALGHLCDENRDVQDAVAAAGLLPVVVTIPRTPESAPLHRAALTTLSNAVFRNAANKTAVLA